MKINGKNYRTIWREQGSRDYVNIINQTKLPFKFEIVKITNIKDAEIAIKDMKVRGAPLIGVTAAYGLALSLKAKHSDDDLLSNIEFLSKSRPTAINLNWALHYMKDKLLKVNVAERCKLAFKLADEIAQDEYDRCYNIGKHGFEIIEQISQAKNGDVVNILTHCNAGWLACVDWGTAIAPMYVAHDKGVKIHIWVDETRPRNQGAYLTAYELFEYGIDHTIISDNSGGHLMQQGLVDLCIVGTDRTAINGDVANKIGTYLKALAAYDNNIPFYVALPSSTIDWNIKSGKDIPIEIRSEEEVTHITGYDEINQTVTSLVIANIKSKARNDAFDVTPAKFVTGLITEKGISAANESAIRKLFSKT